MPTARGESKGEKTEERSGSFPAVSGAPVRMETKDTASVVVRFAIAAAAAAHLDR